MIKRSIALLLAVISFTAFAQTDKGEIQQAFQTYARALEQKDNTTIVEALYPRLFNYYPKEMIMQSMKEVNTSTSLVVAFNNTVITNISEILEISGIKYSLITYSCNLSMQFNETGAGDHENGQSSADFSYEFLKEKYGEQHVDYDRENNKLNAEFISETYAIHDPAYGGWKFLAKAEDIKPVMKKILPGKVLKRL